MLLHGKRAVIFDLDGTLVDSEDFIVWTFLEAGRITGINVDPLEVRKHIGEPLDIVLNSVLPGVPEYKLKEFISVRREIVRMHWKTMVKLFPDVKPALDALKKKGFLLAVASSSTLERIVEFLDYYGVLGYFDAISGVAPGVRGKPAPDVILQAIKSLGVKPAEAVYVGDREVDCYASRSACVDFVYIDRKSLGGFSVSSCTPVAIISDLTEVLNLLAESE
ncbi:MAG: HAD-IA family hydrolase [Desulfurococcaceae archaeon]